MDAAGPGVPAVIEAARRAEVRRSAGAGPLDRLRDWLTERDEVPDGLPIITVPELFSRASGPRVVSLVADALTEELDPDTLSPSSGRGRRG
jgi:hypothetical protein